MIERVSESSPLDHRARGLLGRPAIHDVNVLEIPTELVERAQRVGALRGLLEPLAEHG